MPKLLLPLAAAVAIGAAAGAGVYVATRAETVVEVAPSPVVEASPTPTVDQSPAPSPTPAPTATAPTGGKAADGCLPTELAYADPDGRFAFCYPADMELETGETGYGIAATVHHPINEANRVSVNVGGRVEPYSPCAIQSSAIVRNQTIRDFVIDGRTVQACFKDHYDPTQPDLLLRKTIDFMIPTTDGRPVIFFVVYSGPDFQRQGVAVEEIALRVLHSAVVY